MSESEGAGFSKLRHDLRTCVNQILGYSELLQEEAEDAQPDFVPDLERIRTAGRRLLELLDGLFSDVRPGTSSGSTAVPVARDSEPSSPDNSTAPSGAILVVDDDEMNRDMLSRRLARQGYRAELAEDGREALRRIEAERFDLVLLDVMMPGLSGYEVLESVRKHHSPTELPVIMATAKGESEDVVRAFDLGANDYVTKPIDFPVVLSRIRTQLALHRASEEKVALAREVEIRNRFIRQTFGKYLTDEVVADLLERRDGLQLGGEKRLLTILMADLRGFSSISERLEAREVVAVINNFLETMTAVILEEGGTIDEFIGDAILVVFGAPVGRDDHALAAVRCAVRMQLAMDSVNSWNRDRGHPALEMGIGINTGEVVVGNIGSEKRMKYGVVGSAVNLASRVESFTVGGQILVTSETFDAAGHDVRARGTLSAQPKGYDAPITLHDVGGVDGVGTLDELANDLVELSPSLEVVFTVLTGKDTMGVPSRGELTRLSQTEAEIRTTTLLGPLENLKLVIGSDGGELYAKVRPEATSVDGVARIRFTFVSPEAQERIRALI